MSTLTVLAPVQRDGDDLYTTSETIAAGAGVQHKNTLELIDRHLTDLEDFGGVAFETRPFQTPGGVQNKRVARLNERQATLLLTYLKNTAPVRAFKKALVTAFFEMAATIRDEHAKAPAFALPQTYAEALRALADTAEAREAAEARAAELEPAASAWTVMASASGDYSVDEAAKILSRDPAVEIGRNRLFTLMHELRWTYRAGERGRWHAYQAQVDLGRIVQKATPPFLNARTGEMENAGPTIRVTAKGLEALRRHLVPTKAVLA